MAVLKAALVVAGALGSTWAVREASDAWLSPSVRPAALTQADQPPAQEPAGAASAPAPVKQMTREEMEAELRHAQAELAGKASTAELEEFRPTKPLPADIAIALPSDI